MTVAKTTKNKIHIALLFILSVIFLNACVQIDKRSVQDEIASSADIHYPKVSPNVPFTKVGELVHKPWQKKWSYAENQNSKGQDLQQFILFWPASAKQAGQSPSNHALVFIHGGCWLSQFSIDHSLAFTSALAQQGFDVYSIEYRRSGNNGEWPVALQDIQKALDAINQDMHLKHNGSDFELSLLGHSAGGHLATLAAAGLAASNSNWQSVSATPILPKKLHLFGLAPIIDLPAYAKGNNSCQSATPAFMQGLPEDRPNAYKAANPLNYSLENIATKVMFAGENDAIVPLAMAEHPDATFKVAKGAGHFDWIHPGSDAFKQLIQELKLINQ